MLKSSVVFIYKDNMLKKDDRFGYRPPVDLQPLIVDMSNKTTFTRTTPTKKPIMIVNSFIKS